MSKHSVQGDGCSACTGGIGAYTYSYTASGFGDGYNSWAVKTVEGLPGGGFDNVYYYNAYGMLMLKALRNTATGQSWAWYYRYDGEGRCILVAQPSAMNGYNEASADLISDPSGTDHLNDSQGLVTVFDYYPATGQTAQEQVPGSINNAWKGVSIRQGELPATDVRQLDLQYYTKTVGGVTVTPVATRTVYRGVGASGAQITSATYTYFGGTVSIESATVTYPTVTTAQNGPNSADQVTSFRDRYGRLTWVKDADGFLSYFAYDDATGAAKKAIADVDTALTGTFTDLPAGWASVPGQQLHLTTLQEVDGLGRPTKLTTPEQRVSYTVYNDDTHEARFYDGWTGTAPTGPTRVVRVDRFHRYVDTFTTSVPPVVSNGRPSGGEAIATVQSLTRTHVNVAGQVVATHAYFNVAGVNYATPNYDKDGDFWRPAGAAAKYYVTAYSYTHRGWLNKTVSPTNTITSTTYDGLGRPTETWVGTSDALPGGNMVRTMAYEYDLGGTGDSNLTATTAYPGGGAATRVTRNYYDWRNRLVMTKEGVEASELATVNRPIWYTEYDNLSHAVASERYDGDAVTITSTNGIVASTNGVANRPSAPLRAKSTASYDEQGRVYQSDVWSVDPVYGTVGASLNAQTWYDRRGNVLKSAPPGGLVAKTVYDGVGRPKAVYSTDGGGDNDLWSNADDVTGDAVLEQSEYDYDADGYVIRTTLRQRFHEQTGTGALGSSTSGVLARVSYMGFYYDLAGRRTASVNVGTNTNGSGVPAVWTRPGTVPVRSDTVLVTSMAYDAAGRLQDATDPMARVSRTTYDALGRTTATVENYTGGAITATANKTTEFTYDGVGHLLTYTLRLPSSAYQTTQYVYGVATSTITSNDLLAAVWHPNKATGAASSTEDDLYAYNALGEAVTFADRNGSVHTYTRDVLGRLTADAVTLLGNNVSGTVRRLETAYDGQGNAFRFTSYNAVSGGSVVNDAMRDFNGFGQLMHEYQEHGATLATTASLWSGFEYTNGVSGNHSRATGLVYPSGKTLTDFYTYASGIDNAISRISGNMEGSTAVFGLKYLGLGTVAWMSNPYTRLSYFKETGEANKDGGDQYTGFDRFGRVAMQRWRTALASTDDFRYGYDRNGNRLWRDNVVKPEFGELYAYDPLNQLTSMQRGTLNAAKTAIVGTIGRQQDWAIDGAGNFAKVTSSGTGTQVRTHNRQNQMTAMGGAALAYDANGNLTGDGTWTYTYDAWNRLVQSSKTGTTVVYAVDALGRRAVETAAGVTRHFYYNDRWQVIEERADLVSSPSTDYNDIKVQLAWSLVGSDVLIFRDRFQQGGGGVLTFVDRMYAQQDVQGNVTALVYFTGSSVNVIERYAYDAYGKATPFTGSWGVPPGGVTQYGWRYYHQGLRLSEYDGLYDNRARAYSAEYMRFLQEDPSGFAAGDPDLYRYVGNNPTNHSDPSGLKDPYRNKWWERINALSAIGSRRSLRADDLAYQALTATQRRFPNSRLHNDQADAWRHCVWSASMAVDPILQPDYVGDAETGLNYIFVDFAWAIGYYHEEFGSNGGGQPQIQYAMDMHNNNVGLRIGRQLGPKATFEDVCAACDNALNDGSLIWIEGGQLTKPASYNAPGKLELTSKFPGTYGRPWYIPITTDRNGKPIKKGTPFCPHNVYPFQ